LVVRGINHNKIEHLSVGVADADVLAKRRLTLQFVHFTRKISSAIGELDSRGVALQRSMMFMFFYFHIVNCHSYFQPYFPNKTTSVTTQSLPNNNLIYLICYTKEDNKIR
jgi:hypothetical protein